MQPLPIPTAAAAVPMMLELVGDLESDLGGQRRWVGRGATGGHRVSWFRPLLTTLPALRYLPLCTINSFPRRCAGWPGP